MSTKSTKFYRGLSKVLDIAGNCRALRFDFAAEDDSAAIARDWASVGSDTHAVIKRCMQGLSREAQLVLVLYYYERMNPVEIGQVLGLPEVRVAELHKHVLEIIRDNLPRDAASNPVRPTFSRAG